MNLFLNIISETWDLLLESSIYILFGLLISGFLRVFLSPHSIAKHLSRGRFLSVFKAAFFGIPVPLCSCGVLPAAIGLRKQGANRGATTAFLISTPESGVDSIAISYALLDPIMTIARPVSAFITAMMAGLSVNLFGKEEKQEGATPDLSCPIDACCDGQNCPPDVHKRHHSLYQKIVAGIQYAFFELWGDLTAWFFVGLILAGCITAIIPTDLFSRYLGGGIQSMLIMLVMGIPIYICATASTPIAAALILKGISPGAALVFLLAGPATNITTLTVLIGTLGKRATVIYLTCIGVISVLAGLLVDQVYHALALAPHALIGQAAEIVPTWLSWLGAFFLLGISIKPLYHSLGSRLKKWIGKTGDTCQDGHSHALVSDSNSIPLSDCAKST